jgi:hypothetical protein
MMPIDQVMPMQRQSEPIPVDLDCKSAPAMCVIAHAAGLKN